MSSSDEQQKIKDQKLQEFLAKHEQRIIQWRKTHGSQPTPILWDGKDFKWLNRKQRRP